MLTRSITKCYHRPTFATPAHLHALHFLTRIRCGCCASNLRLQSTSTSSPPPPDGKNHNDAEHPNPPAISLALKPTSLHHDLPTFLAHAHRVGLSPTSTTYIGTRYEYTVARTLRRFGFDLKRTGGRGDAGIDLLGVWHLPPALAPQPLRVLVQCKALKAKLGPNLIRELEGAFVGAPAGFRAKQGSAGGVVGILVSPREATRGVREAMGRSRWPMVWIMLEVAMQQHQRGRQATASGEEDAGGGEGKVRQVLWNKAAGEAGLEGLDVTIRYERAVGGEEGVGKECVLMWQGKPVTGLDE
jgi:hypothetical protein